MATRIYLPSTGSAPVTPSTWNFPYQVATTYTLAGVLTKIASAFQSRLRATGTTSGRHLAIMRYVIGPLSAVQISGTVNLVIRANENNAGANATLAIAVKIIKPDGSDRAILLAYTASDNPTSPYELTTTLASARAYNVSETRPIPLTNQTPAAGDYLVIEVGFRQQTTVNRNVYIRHGDNSANDLADGEGEINDYCGYVDFSVSLPLAEEHSGSGVISGNGSVSGAAQKGGRGSAITSGAGALLALGLVGMLGLAGISGGGSQVGLGQRAAESSAAISAGGSVTAAGEKGMEQHAGAGVISGGGVLSSIGSRSGVGMSAISANGSLSALAGKSGAGVAALPGGGSAVAGGEKLAQDEAGISGSGQLGADGLKGGKNSTAISGDGTTGSTGIKGALEEPEIFGGGLLTASGIAEEEGSPDKFGEAVLNGGGSPDVLAEKQAFGIALISGGGALFILGIKPTRKPVPGDRDEEDGRSFSCLSTAKLLSRVGK